MKKRTALILSAAALLSGCTFDPFGNMASGVYGPPPAESETVQTFSPSDNQNTEVYGPPPASETQPEETSVASDENEENISSELTSVTSEETAETDEETEFDPADNIPPTLYGPPRSTVKVDDIVLIPADAALTDVSAEPDSEDE